jgi:CubicO group peptidase (beta-lactamase class C family)
MGRLPEYYNHYANGAGGLFSTASDVARFAQWLLNKGKWQGRQLLSEESVRQLGIVQTGDVMVNPNEGYGLGMFVKKRQDESVGVGSFGHRGARRTVFWVDPTNQIVVVLMLQRMDMDGNQQKELYGPFFKAAVDKFGKSRPGS